MSIEYIRPELRVEYRREIDGLRALAVIPVVFYHAGFKAFAGGYVGVDVFFVISGYLITGIVLGDLQAGRFSIVTFYERRARRILPALFLVMAACIPFAWLWLMPTDLKEFAQSVVAVSGFASNVFFWIAGGYFDSAAELKPLLHTWSLAVEEQFYLFFPLLLAATWRLGKKFMVALIVLASFASLGAAQWGSANSPTAAFFLLPARAWELAMGSLIAFHFARAGRPARSPPGHQVLAFAGLALLVYSVVAFDETTPFPSLWALAPTAGTALMILFAWPGTHVARLLGSRVLVAVGLMSYSVYLWHQPLFAFARHRSLEAPGVVTRLVLSASAFGLAYLSWRFVEQAFRSKQTIGRRGVFAFAVAGSAALATVGLAGHLGRGLPDRRFASLPADYLRESWLDFGSTKGVDGNACVSERASVCRINEQPGSRRILLAGDSHSADFLPEFRALAVRERLDAWQMSVGGCAFIPRHFDRGECRAARALLEQTVASVGFQEIVFVTNMEAHLEGLSPERVSENLDSLEGLVRTMLASGAKVIFVAPRPHFRVSPTKAAQFDALAGVSPAPEPRRRELDDLVRILARDGRFVTFDQTAVLVGSGCGAVECFDGHTRTLTPLYRDRNHLTAAGARLVFREVRPLLGGAALSGR